ncbi:DUF817 domain-containing protein [Metabacillus sp. GX 13764]|uniref:DUF817 domain-containing protein n=1 Tax=Metabacillus kandeliae TaxID=2900151 RepID=UPI001E608643|nr:DUF817 domain-containing protein [Metabacillus kandeliae]MCD7033576.1 DUF817 domain-containing protein [Metabacillus kandeliae]
MKKHSVNFLLFGWQQALSCLFPAAIFLALAVTKYLPPMPLLHRYDLILMICLFVQWLMVKYKLETKDELKVILLFHVLGLLLEIYKVHIGSWSYPEKAWTKIFDVPLYSGFMYASVGSYICQAWRGFDLDVLNWPGSKKAGLLGILIYGNFFSNHYMYDLRWFLFAAILLLFFRCYVTFKVNGTVYSMPLSLSFVLIGFFIWIAENIATFFGAWQYPDQHTGWQVVHPSKISSWLLLVIVSFLLTAQLKMVKQGKSRSRSAEPVQTKSHQDIS